jgi:ADP-heptose:LPS heptosyltransferase
VFAAQGQPRLTCSQPERQEAESFLHEKGLVGRPLVGICPVASLELKRWPFERFLNVADWILAESACSVLFFCGPHPELAARAKARVRDGDRLACVERLHLRAVAALVERCQAFLCNDTGLSHIAAALEIPTVTIFGITEPRVYQPPGPGTASVGGTVSCPHRNTRSLEPPLCFFTGRCLIANQGCITSVREAEVLRALEEMLQSSLGARVPHPSAAAQRPAQMGGRARPRCRPDPTAAAS